MTVDEADAADAARAGLPAPMGRRLLALGGWATWLLLAVPSIGATLFGVALIGGLAPELFVIVGAMVGLLLVGLAWAIRRAARGGTVALVFTCLVGLLVGVRSLVEVGHGVPRSPEAFDLGFLVYVVALAISGLGLAVGAALSFRRRD